MLLILGSNLASVIGCIGAVYRLYTDPYKTKNASETHRENRREKYMSQHKALRTANHRDTSRVVLEDISKVGSEAIRVANASGENTSKEILLGLIGDESLHAVEDLKKNKVPIILNNMEVCVCKHIKLRLASVEDSEFILDLRSDPALNQHVSAVEKNLEKQIEWMLSYKERERNGSEFYFIIESIEGAPYGTVRLYDFKDGSFCWGSWMIRKGSPVYAAIESALTIYEFGFYTLKFQRSHFDVRKGNDTVVKFHEGFGAKRTSSDTENYYFNFEKSEYEDAKKRYKIYFA